MLTHDSGMTEFTLRRWVAQCLRNIQNAAQASHLGPHWALSNKAPMVMVSLPEDISTKDILWLTSAVPKLQVLAKKVDSALVFYGRKEGIPLVLKFYSAFTMDLRTKPTSLPNRDVHRVFELHLKKSSLSADQGSVVEIVV